MELSSLQRCWRVLRCERPQRRLAAVHAVICTVTERLRYATVPCRSARRHHAVEGMHALCSDVPPRFHACQHAHEARLVEAQRRHRRRASWSAGPLPAWRTAGTPPGMQAARGRGWAEASSLCAAAVHTARHQVHAGNALSVSRPHFDHDLPRRPYG